MSKNPIKSCPFKIEKIRKSVFLIKIDNFLYPEGSKQTCFWAENLKRSSFVFSRTSSFEDLIAILRKVCGPKMSETKD